MNEVNTRGEWIRFGLLVAVLLLTILVIWAIRPFIANNVVPAFLDTATYAPPATHQQFAPIIDSGEETAPAEEMEVQPMEETVVEPETAVDPPPAVEQTAPEQLTHVIQPGENLFVLAQRYNITVQQIVEANSITNPNRIAVGDELIIPQP